MSISNILKHPRALRYGLLLGMIAALAAIAQTGRAPADSRILVDGSKEPERVPEWILWNAVFRIAVMQSEKAGRHGEELWVDRLHLPKDAMTKIVASGYRHRDLHAAAETEAQQILSDARGKPDKEQLRLKLRKTQGFEEARTLEMRDKLRARIGEDAFLRLQSYAQLHIAPQILVGR